VTGNCRPESEQLVASAEGATSNPERGEGGCHPARMLKLSVGNGGNDGNNTATSPGRAVRFAACLGNKGGKDFRDPTADRSLIDMIRIPSAAGKVAHSIPGLRAAADKCTALCSGALGLEGK
jgi:hypothetical protein